MGTVSHLKLVKPRGRPRTKKPKGDKFSVLQTYKQEPTKYSLGVRNALGFSTLGIETEDRDAAYAVAELLTKGNFRLQRESE